MTTPLRVQAPRVVSYLGRVRTDSLVRNSLYLMASTVITAGLGYVFWVLAARRFPSREVGISSAVISLCSTIALLTYLGSSATLIERLPIRERSSEWNAVLVRVCTITALTTAAVTAAAVPVLLTSLHYRQFFSSALPVVMTIVGAASWTLVNLLGAAFISARRAGRLLSLQGLVSLGKLVLVLPLGAAGLGAVGLVGAWAASAFLGVLTGTFWLIPRMRLGRRPGPRPRRRVATAPEYRPEASQRPRHRRSPGPPSAASVRHLLGQHLTSVGGAVTPLVLPVLVVIRLGVTLNAYFYITWMVGSAFFMVSPSVAQAVFAEGVRARSDLRKLVAKALRVIAVLLVPVMGVMIAGGRLVLGLFGSSYAAAGYGLLIVLAISAVPDAVSNVAVVICRVTGRLGYSSALNLGILAMTLAGAWFLMPLLGIAGAGLAWLAAQVVGAIACLPVYVATKGSQALTAPGPGGRETPAAETVADAGIALLIEISRRQSLGRLGGRLP